MPKFDVLTGERYRIKAANANEARAKLYAYISGENCPCGFPQWAEQAAAEDHELCMCVGDPEVDTWVADN